MTREHQGEEAGLYRKYDVRRTDGSDHPGGRHHGCRYLVLDLDHDPEARQAALEFARLVRDERPQVARDLAVLIGTLRAGESGRWKANLVRDALAAIRDVR